jgi:hypothetical protein
MDESSSPYTIESVFEYLFGEATMSSSKIIWPPDAFCFAATVLQKSAAYTTLIGDNKPFLEFNHLTETRAAALESIGRAWRDSTAKGKSLPRNVAEWLQDIEEGKKIPLSKLSLKDHKRTVASLTNLMACADEACAGIGLNLAIDSGVDDFARLAELQLFPAEHGSSLCKRIHPSRARVLPKCHTAQSGLTIRSFSHFLALVPSSEVSPLWYNFPTRTTEPSDTGERALNLLLVPWPTSIKPRQFTPTRLRRFATGGERNGYGSFTFRAERSLQASRLRSLVQAAEHAVGKIDGVIFPELALDPKGVDLISNAIVRQNRFLIAGVGEPAKLETSSFRRQQRSKLSPNANNRWACGKNYVRFDVALAGGEFVVGLEQSKHHRWKLDRSQILQYGIGSALQPDAHWWEHINVSSRSLMFFALKPWLTLSVLLCEDLARPDPLGDLVRSVGPNLLVALLMDGPQIPGRWPGRYATTFADDPGCSVLTLTSAGMSKLSQPTQGSPNRSECIALWKDARGVAREVLLPNEADAVVLTIAVQFEEEWTADNRGDRKTAGFPYLAGQHAIKLSSAKL